MTKKPTYVPSFVPSYSPTTASSILDPPSGPYTYVGCYGDNFSSRAMIPLVGKIVSISDCYNLAINANYQYFGLQYGNQCYGSNDMQVSTKYGICPFSTGSVKACTCNKPCGGIGSETCGGQWATDMYAVTTSVDKITQKPATIPTIVPTKITSIPSVRPSLVPIKSLAPIIKPVLSTVFTNVPSRLPSILPLSTSIPSIRPTLVPLSKPTTKPSFEPTPKATNNPTYGPSTNGAYDWYTSSYNNQRTGLNPYETRLNTNTVYNIKRIWSFKTVGSVIAQPVTACNFNMPSGKRKCVAFFGDESGYFYAIDIANGKQEWKIFLGYNNFPRCSDLPGGDFSISGTATFDRSKNTVYVVGGAGNFNAIQMTTGTILWQIKNFYDPQMLHNYGGLLLQNNIVYAEFGSMCDLSGSYIGTLYAINTITRSIAAQFQPSDGFSGGGMWGLAGPTLGDMSSPDTSAIYQPTGNCMSGPESGHRCEKVVKLDVSTLIPQGSLNPPPSDPSQAADNDFGSSATFFNGINEPRIGGCMNPMVTAFRKSGQMIVGTADTFQSTQNFTFCSDGEGFIQQSSWDPDSNTLLVPIYCESFIVAYQLNSDCKLVQKWLSVTQYPITASATIAGPAGKRIAVIPEGSSFEIFDIQTGANLVGLKSLSSLHFSQNAPVIINGTIMFSTMDNGAANRGVQGWR